MDDPYRFLAVQGTLDMIEAAPDKILPVIPQVSPPKLKRKKPHMVQHYY